jgi:hypothetical protein
MSKFKRITAISLILLLLVSSYHINTISAATVKINKTTLSMLVGEKSTLSITGTSKKVTWSTSDKNIASVNSNGKVSAIAPGKATITGKIGTKKFTCKITVKKDKTVTVTVTNLLTGSISDYLSTLDIAKTVVNDDYTTTYTFNQSTQKLILSYLKKMINTIELSELPSYYTEYKINKDMTTINLTLDQDEYNQNKSNDSTILTFFIIGAGYQQFQGLSDDDINVRIKLIDKTTRKVFKTYDKSDLFATE